jgi:hypothetical protein
MTVEKRLFLLRYLQLPINLDVVNTHHDAVQSLLRAKTIA